MFPSFRAQGVGLLLVAALGGVTVTDDGPGGGLGSQAPAQAFAQPAAVPGEQQRPESAIAADLRRVNAQVRVSCDAPITAQGRCVALIDGQRLTYEARAGGRGNVTYVRTRAVVDLNRQQSRVARAVAAQVGGKWRVRCTVAGSSRFYVVAVDRRFSCPIAGKDGQGVRRAGTIVFQVRDVRGAVSWEAQ